MIDALNDVIEGHAERICQPGKWRVYRAADGGVVLEVFRTATKSADPTPQS